MKPEARNPQNPAVESPEITPTELFATLSSDRRQYALSYLAQKPAAIPLGDLAEYLAVTENRRSYEWYQRILVDLHHQHLPYLADVGLVRYDDQTELVELAVDRSVVDPYLRLARRDQ
ncbi:hypothetical protein OB905_12200 [Halobacteria archaeon AArc-dxtr1]|nr:hypothetical protein [Halobacteria archaeon AArc-dxtr1]